MTTHAQTTATDDCTNALEFRFFLSSKRIGLHTLIINSLASCDAIPISPMHLQLRDTTCISSGLHPATSNSIDKITNRLKDQGFNHVTSEQKHIISEQRRIISDYKHTTSQEKHIIPEQKHIIPGQKHVISEQNISYPHRKYDPLTKTDHFQTDTYQFSKLRISIVLTACEYAMFPISMVSLFFNWFY